MTPTENIQATIIPPKACTSFEDLTTIMNFYIDNEKKGSNWRQHFTPAENKRYSRIKLLGMEIEKMKQNLSLDDIKNHFFQPGAVPPSLSKLISHTTSMNNHLRIKSETQHYLKQLTQEDRKGLKEKF